MFQNILDAIGEVSHMDFETASKKLENVVDSEKDFIDLLQQIGTIPEAIEHDSTEEKLFSKVSDAALARAFREIGLKSTVLRERGDSADVLAESPIHGYTLVADAKAFRMSRTAKNQKDFKVVALSGWRRDAEYAVLCSPYFQYPLNTSQIYTQAIQNNVCLFSWEHFIFLIRNGVKETVKLDLSGIWGFCDQYSHKIPCSDMKKCFLKPLNETLLQLLSLDKNLLADIFNTQIRTITKRGFQERTFWQDEIKKIEAYTKEEAITELIKSKKIREKIFQIDLYVKGLRW